MNLYSYTIAGVATLFICLLVPITGRRSLHHGSSHSHDSSLSQLQRFAENEEAIEANVNDRDLLNYLTRQEDHQVECHKSALHKCGQTFLRAFKLLSFLSDDVAFKTKCGLRTAFFNCLKKTREKICKKHYKHYFHYESGFRKKIADALWSTRVCVLGIKGVRSQS